VQLDGVDRLLREPDGDLAPPRVLRVDDASTVVLNPGVTEKVVYLWEQAKSEPVPADVTVEVIEPTRRRDSLDGTLQWKYQETSVVGAVTVPVERLPSEAEE
jgi:hypothetical protein